MEDNCVPILKYSDSFDFLESLDVEVSDDILVPETEKGEYVKRLKLQSSYTVTTTDIRVTLCRTVSLYSVSL